MFGVFRWATKHYKKSFGALLIDLKPFGGYVRNFDKGGGSFCDYRVE